MHGQRHHFENIGLIEHHRWIDSFGFGQASFFRRRHLLWQWSRNNVGGLLGRLRLSFLVRAAGALYVIPTMPFGVPIQPFIWPQLPGLLLGQAGLRRCCRYCRQEEQ